MRGERMHRKNCVPRVLLGGLLLFWLLYAGGAAPVWGQADAEQPQQPKETLLVPINNTRDVHMSKGELKDYPNIAVVRVDKEGVIQAEALQDRRLVRLKGLAPGITRLTL